MGKLKARGSSSPRSVLQQQQPCLVEEEEDEYWSSASSECVPRSACDNSDNSARRRRQQRRRRRRRRASGRMIVNLDQIPWKYRAEGNANLVLALPHTQRVLRLKKVDLVLGTPAPGAGGANENFLFLKSVVDYIKEISALLLDDFLIDPQLVILLLKDMEAFNKQLNQFRPVDRLSKEIRFPFGIMYPDVTFLPSYLTTSATEEPIFCVEIKPKQGWKFNGSVEDEEQFKRLFHLPDRSMLSQCRYCVMQHLKYKKGKINSLSNYCPLDLFSGHLPKMTKAIENLIDCPQNNLRIFRNGCQVYGNQQYHHLDRLHNALEEIFGSKDRQWNLHQFTHLLASILLKEYTVSVVGSDSRSQREPRQKKESNLPVNCVLQQILNVQRHVYDFFSSVNVSGGEALKGEEEKEEDQCDNRNRIIREELVEGGKFKQYQYGATALDCSLMITFQRIEGEKGRTALDEALAKKFIVQQDDVHFLSKITIMDLDPKPFTHAVKYVEQTQASYQTEWSRRQSILF